MKPAPLPPDEAARLAKLHSYNILDSANERDYDDIVQLVASICQTPIANISFVDHDRQWFKAAVGLREDQMQTPREVAFCAHTILGHDLFVVPDAHVDERFEDNPLVIGDPKVRFYAGMPIETDDGFRLGSLCAIDRVPRALDENQTRAMRILSRHVVHLLELRAKTRRIEEQNRRLEELSELKSRLIAIMAHDLRSPLANIAAVVELLSDDAFQAADRDELIADLKATLDTTQYLLKNAIEWATRQLQSAELQIKPVDVRAVCAEVMESLEREAQAKGNRLEFRMDQEITIYGDQALIVFVVRNIMSNANKFTSDGTIALVVEAADTRVRFRITDTGVGMSAERLATLFEWGRRRSGRGTAGEKGSGLALLFAHDFIQRVGGSIQVTSELGTGTTFDVHLPLQFEAADQGADAVIGDPVQQAHAPRKPAEPAAV